MNSNKSTLRVKVTKASNWKYEKPMTIPTGELWSLLDRLNKQYECDVIVDTCPMDDYDAELQIYDDYVE